MIPSTRGVPALRVSRTQKPRPDACSVEVRTAEKNRWEKMGLLLGNPLLNCN